MEPSYKIRRNVIGVLVQLGLLVALVVVAANVSAAAICEQQQDDRWTVQENDVLEALCKGNPARASGKDVPVLGADFLRTLIDESANEPELLKKGIRIDGARILESLDWSGIEVTGPLVMDNVIFEKSVKLSYASFPRSLSFDGSDFRMSLIMNGVSIGRYFMARGCKMKALDLRVAHIKGSVHFTGSNITGGVDLHRTVIDQSLAMNTPRQYKAADKLRPGVPGEHTLGRIGGRVTLEGAKIGGVVDFRGTRFEKPVNMRRITVGKSLMARSSAEFVDVLILQGADISGLVDLSGTYFKQGVDLSNARIQEDLVVGQDRTKQQRCSRWADKAWLRLTNTQIFTLRDRPCGKTINLAHWPKNIFLTGFRYDLLSGADQEDAAVFANRDASWLIDWLGLQQQYSPEPYKQLATVLSSFGYADSAHAVAIASKKREMRTTDNYFQKINLAAQWLFIDYGYGYWRVAAWVMFFTLAGTAVLLYTNNPKDAKFTARFFYSLDRLIPLIHLSDTHFKPELPSPVCYYFFVHRLVGFVLASYLVAGITGIAA